MIKRSPLLMVLMVAVLAPALTSCETVTDLFKETPPPPLSGDRRPALPLDQAINLIPDTEAGTATVPDAWSADNWPQAGGHAGHAMQNLALSSGDLQKKWSTDIGTGSTKAVPLTAQPVVMDGRLYAMDSENQLSSIDIKTGKVYWRLYVGAKFEDDVAIGGGLAAVDGRIYITNGYAEALALTESGEEVWRVRLPAPARAAPAVLDGRVYVMTLDGQILSMNIDDGVQLWSYRGITDGTRVLGAPTPAVDREIVVAPFSSGELVALRVENGTVAWADNLAPTLRFGGLDSLADIRAHPILDDKTVIAISYAGRLVAIDERTGARVWQSDIGGGDTPWVAAETIYVLSKESTLVALSKGDGLVRWRLDLPRYDDPNSKKNPVLWAGPMMAGGRLLVTGTYGRALWVDPQSGQVVGEMNIGDTLAVPPLVVQNTLFTLARDGTLTAWK